MQKMKAFVRTSSQNQHVELTEIPIPEINDDEVLVKVHAFGVGIHDRYFIPNNAIFPYPIGTEAAGVITKTGGTVTQFQVGDRVILTSILQAKGGCWAEYVAVPQSNLILMPAEMDFTTRPFDRAVVVMMQRIHLPAANQPSVKAHLPCPAGGRRVGAECFEEC